MVVPNVLTGTDILWVTVAPCVVTRPEPGSLWEVIALVTVVASEEILIAVEVPSVVKCMVAVAVGKLSPSVECVVSVAVEFTVSFVAVGKEKLSVADLGSVVSLDFCVCSVLVY